MTTWPVHLPRPASLGLPDRLAVPENQPSATVPSKRDAAIECVWHRDIASKFDSPSLRGPQQAFDQFGFEKDVVVAYGKSTGDVYVVCTGYASNNTAPLSGVAWGRGASRLQGYGGYKLAGGVWGGMAPGEYQAAALRSDIVEPLQHAYAEVRKGNLRGAYRKLFPLLEQLMFDGERDVATRVLDVLCSAPFPPTIGVGALRFVSGSAHAIPGWTALVTRMKDRSTAAGLHNAMRGLPE